MVTFKPGDKVVLKPIDECSDRAFITLNMERFFGKTVTIKNLGVYPYRSYISGYLIPTFYIKEDSGYRYLANWVMDLSTEIESIPFEKLTDFLFGGK